MNGFQGLKILSVVQSVRIISSHKPPCVDRGNMKNYKIIK